MNDIETTKKGNLMKTIRMQTVLAKFPNGKATYSYFVPEGDHPRVGDAILTSVSWNTDVTAWDDVSDGEDFAKAPHPFMKPHAPGMADEPAKSPIEMAVEGRLATIVEIEMTVNVKATRFYMWLIPAQELRNRKAQNTQMLMRARKRKEAAAKLDQLFAERNKIEMYRELAKSDPEAAALLKVLEGQDDD